MAGVGCVFLFPGVVAAAASTMVAAFTLLRTVGENAPPVLWPSSKSESRPMRAWNSVGDDSRTGEGRRRRAAAPSERRDSHASKKSPALFCESAVPGVDPAPAELKLRSKSSVVREKAAAGVMGVRAAGLGDLGVSGALRAGSVGVDAKRFATAASCACSVLGESGWPSGARGARRSDNASLALSAGFSLSNTRVCFGSERGRETSREGRGGRGQRRVPDAKRCFASEHETRDAMTRPREGDRAGARAYLEGVVPHDPASVASRARLHGGLRLHAAGVRERARARHSAGTRLGRAKTRSFGSRKTTVFPPLSFARIGDWKHI